MIENTTWGIPNLAQVFGERVEIQDRRQVGHTVARLVISEGHYRGGQELVRRRIGGLETLRRGEPVYENAPTARRC